MSYSIEKKTGLDIDYCGHATEYSIDFTFKRQKANMTVEISLDVAREVRIVSNTDGYHWLQFFLSQDIETTELLNEAFDVQVAKCRALFRAFGIEYEQEDKETAYLLYPENMSEENLIKTIADIVEPRFANRERFFEK